MSLSIRKDIHSDLVTQILDDVQYQKTNYYYFLGKSDAWNDDDIPVDIFDNSQVEENLIRTNALYFRKVSPNEVSLVCKRYIWKSGRIYHCWDNTLDMSQLNFYVFTDDFNVYKCLDNAAFSESTVKPQLKSFTPFRTPDGYLWKYMYTVPAFKRRMFISGEYVPVQKAISENFYNRGAIESVSVLSGGENYVDQQLTTINQTGGTTVGAGASCSIVSVDALGAITGIQIDSGGSNYTAGAFITITSASGINAVLVPEFTGGVLTSVDIVEPGVGYATIDSLLVEVGHAVLLPIMNHNTGSLVDVKIIHPGAGYTVAPTLTLVSQGGTPDGLYPENSTALLEAIISEGQIKRIVIQDPGKGYSVDSATTIVATGDGSGARLEPVIYQGKIIDVAVVDGGEGYSQVTVSVIGSGTGAQLRGNISTSDLSTDQSVVEQTAIPDQIYAIKVTVPGEGYTNSTRVVIEGDGTGAEATAVINSEGKVTRIIVTEFGNGYTYASTKIEDPNRYDPAGLLTVAECYPILPPPGGHGKNAVKELYTDTIVFSTLLRTDEKLAVVDQDYRQFGVIHKPLSIQTGDQFKDPTYVDVFNCVLLNTVGMMVDEVVSRGKNKFRVISVQGNEAWLQPLSSKNASPVGVLVADADSNRTYECTRIKSQPTLNKFSGNLLYVTNQEALEFSEDQGILVKTYLTL